MNGGATDERARQKRGSRDIAGEESGDVSMRLSAVALAKADTRRTAHGTKTPRLLSKGTPHNEDQEVTQDQRI
jgi:hypothetical protein